MTRMERFMQHVNKTEECWLWTGSILKKSGYGRIDIKRKHYKAHRLSYELFKGSLNDLHVCHTCDVRHCVNPDHLWLGTITENIADRDAKGRTARGASISNTAKLTEAKVLEMRALWNREGALLKPGQHGKPGLNYSRLGILYGVSPPMARNIILRKNWKHV